tara:strand:+ start:874 stop:1239 length:366 start_codon:yes stop_codon:yes gene_type:complete
VRDRRTFTTNKDQEYWKQIDENLEEYYFKRVKDLGRDPLKEFRRLLAEDELEDLSLYKAKELAIRHNFSDQLVADEIRPYKYGPKRVSYYFLLQTDTFWGAEEWASDDPSVKPSFGKLVYW